MNEATLERARAANLVEYFRHSGYECEPQGKGEYRVHGFGGLSVNPEKGTWYHFSADKGGHNSIDCLTHVLNCDFKSAVSELTGVSPVQSRTTTPDESVMPIFTQRAGFEQSTIERARAANLVDYFEKTGHKCVKREHGNYFVEGFGRGLSVTPKLGSWFHISTGKGGNNSVDCLCHVLKCDFKVAVSELTGVPWSQDLARKRNEPAKTAFIKPEHAPNIKNVYAYLSLTRELDPKLVSKLISDKLLYQDKKGNAVFVHHDDKGNMVGAELQGTLTQPSTGKHFHGVATGTHNSLFKLDCRSNKDEPPTKVYAFESAIDLLSFRQMAGEEKLNGCMLVSMAGLKYESIRQYAEVPGVKVLSCVDNDEKGRAFAEKHGLKSGDVLVRENVKDFNELLKKRNAEAGITPKPKPKPPAPDTPDNPKQPQQNKTNKKGTHHV